MYFPKEANTEHTSNPPNSERTIYGSFAFWFAVLVVTDQLVKYLAMSSNWRYFKNYNFAFSVPLPTYLMYLIYGIILAAILYYAGRNFHRFTKKEIIAWMLILAGAISNIGERIILGYVRDYIYIITGIFNLADGYILLGAALLLTKVSKNEQK